jgi:hypothetical protein
MRENIEMQVVIVSTGITIRSRLLLVLFLSSYILGSKLDALIGKSEWVKIHGLNPEHLFSVLRNQNRNSRNRRSFLP